MKPYRIKVTVRNNLLLTAIEEQGYATVAAFERAASIPMNGLAKLVAMRTAPLLESGGFSLLAKNVMEVLGAAPTDLWTEQQLTIRLKTNTGERAIDADLIQHLLEQRNKTAILPSPEDALLAAETTKIMNEVLDSLTPREKKVLQLRFYQEEKLESTGKAFDVSTERIRQIEGKALRKLRCKQTSKLIDAGLWRNLERLL